jgi:hypothetical protein
MTIETPLDALYTLPTFEHGLKYDGTLDSILNELDQERDCSDNLPDNLRTRAFHPSRIICVVTDYKIEHPSEEADSLLRSAISVALELYSDLDTEVVSGFRDELKTSGIEDLLTKTIVQPSDRITSLANSPNRSSATVNKIATKSDSKDILLIALGHGGVAAGMDVFLKYCDETDSEGSTFYTARLSTQKLYDKKPQLSPNEVEYLKGLAQGREIVIFDEDVSSGRSLMIAHEFFSSEVFPERHVSVVTNLDANNVLARKLPKYCLISPNSKEEIDFPSLGYPSDTLNTKINGSVGIIDESKSIYNPVNLSAAAKLIAAFGATVPSDKSESMAAAYLAAGEGEISKDKIYANIPIGGEFDEPLSIQKMKTGWDSGQDMSYQDILKKKPSFSEYILEKVITDGESSHFDKNLGDSDLEEFVYYSKGDTEFENGLNNKFSSAKLLATYFDNLPLNSQLEIIGYGINSLGEKINQNTSNKKEVGYLTDPNFEIMPEDF